MTKNNQKIFNISESKLKHIEKSVELFIKKENYGFETRYKSWNNCHDYFSQLHINYNGKQFKNLNEVDKQLSILYLSFYLASWGMYRGSSFVLQYDNSIYEKVIDIILDGKYELLWDINYETILNNKLLVKDLIIEIRNKINKALNCYRVYFNTKNKLPETMKKGKNEAFISQTLTTKILLGTICCCPAYDTYFSNEIGGRFKDFYNDDKVDNLLELILQNDIFRRLSERKGYPLMKIVDMAYFNMGIEKDFEKEYNKYILPLEEPKTEKDWKNLAKHLKSSYYKLNPSEDYDLHIAFKCDKSIVDKFIVKYKNKIENVLLSIKENED